MNKLINETGNRYGRLLVVERVENDKFEQAQWLCRCDCGNTTVITGTRLRRGEVNSCGCLRRELARSRQVKLGEEGNRYGRWTVLEYAGVIKRKASWLCRCDCGNEVVVPGVSFRSGNSRSCGCLAKELNSLPDGEGAFNALFRSYKQAARRRKLVWKIEKEQFHTLTRQTCHYCGIKPSQEYHTGRREGEHVGNGVYIYNGIDRLNPALGYVLENVVACCSRCNYAKREMSLEEFVSWLKSVHNHLIGAA